MFFRHPLHPHGKDDSNDGRQSLGNGRHSQTDGGHEHLKGRLFPQNAHDKNDAADDQCTNSQHLACFPQFFLQRGFIFFLPRKEISNMTDFRFHPNCRNNGFSTACCHKTACQYHISPVPCRKSCSKGSRFLLRCQGFPCDSTFFHFQAMAVKKPSVRADIIPCRKQKDIPCYHIFRRNLPFHTIPKDPCLRCGKFL